MSYSNEPKMTAARTHRSATAHAHAKAQGECPRPHCNVCLEGPLGAFGLAMAGAWCPRVGNSVTATRHRASPLWRIPPAPASVWWAKRVAGVCHASCKIERPGLGEVLFLAAPVGQEACCAGASRPRLFISSRVEFRATPFQ